MSFSNPLNIALLIPIGYLIFRAILPQKPSPEVPPTTYSAGVYNWAPDKHPEVGVWKEYTPAELTESDGVKSPRILLAIAKMDKDQNIIERTVFDVSKGANFYGPEGMYGNFAGRDASRGMAKQSFDEEMLTPIDQPLDTLTDLTKGEIDNMHGWHEHFTGKYTVCGVLVQEKGQSS